MKTILNTIKISRNQWSNRVRKLKKEISLDIFHPETPADAVFPNHLEIQLYERLFWTSFNELPETCRKILLLHWKDHSPHEINDLLQISESYVKKQKSICTQHFVMAVKNHKEYELMTKSTLKIKSKRNH